MAKVRVLKQSFAGGEVTPEFFGRIDDAKYLSGLAQCKNFVVKPHGPAENRAGLEFVREVKDSSKLTRLIPFTFSTTQTMVIEVGEQYFRFHTQGATLLDAGVPYEVAHPYLASEIFDIHYVQSADVLTLVHPNHKPRELRRLGATNWELKTIGFDAPDAPTGLALARQGGSEEKYDYEYVVTAVGEDEVGESAASAPKKIKGNLFETGQVIKVSWDAVADATSYIVYKYEAGIFGYLGQTEDLELIDNDIVPDTSKTPPKYDADLFDDAGNYPRAVSYHEQRRCFAGTDNHPQNIWMTKSGTESNMSHSLPLRADDRIKFKVAAREANTIRHIVPLTDLVLLTSSAEWRVSSSDGDALSPFSIAVKPQSFIGASNAQPVIINNNLIYGAARGGHIRELAYDWQAGGYVTGDLSLRAPHLFDGMEVTDIAYSKAPIPIVWFISTSGKLLGFTYVPEQKVGAWHQHETDGTFESATVVAEGHEDHLYVVVKREVDGQIVRYVERMHSRAFRSQEHAFFVDSGLKYEGAPTDSISGLDHLEGKTVSILVDGAVHPQRVVENGAIDLEVEASVIIVGLPIVSDMQTLPVAVQLQDGSFGQGRMKNVNKVWLRVHESSGIWIGPCEDTMREHKQRTNEPYGSPPELKSEEVEILSSNCWNDSGQMFIRQQDPLPLTVIGLTMEVALGG